MELFTLGIDLGKTTFHLVGMNQRGEVVLRKTILSSAAVALYCEPEGEADRHGSMRGIAFSGAGVAGARARGTADSSAICEALRQDEQERLHRRRSHRRSSGKTDHAFCAGQE